MNKQILITIKSKQPDDAEFWQTMFPQERISAVQFLREQYMALFNKQNEDLVIQLGLPPKRIDILCSILGVGFKEAYLDADKTKMFNEEVRFISIIRILF